MKKELLKRIQELANINEMAQPASDEEYYSAVSDFYKDENLLNIIKQGEQMAMQMSGDVSSNTQKTDYGNVIVKWLENDEAVFLLGIVSKQGKITREDVPDLNIWIDELISKIEEGKILYTSPNKISERLIRKVIKKIESKGIDLDIKEMSSLSLGDEPHLSWKNMIIRRK